jgi:hypothetical protein
MTRTGAIGLMVFVIPGLFWPNPVHGQAGVRRTAPSVTPASTHRLVPFAETRLLMEGLTNANFLGLEKLLRSEQLDDEAWAFSRGQALLIAESGNLLLLRSPRDSRQETWMRLAGDMRDSAGQLARWVQRRDLGRSRSALMDLAGKCNACHQAFRADVQIRPFRKDFGDRDE